MSVAVRVERIPGRASVRSHFVVCPPVGAPWRTAIGAQYAKQIAACPTAW